MCECICTCTLRSLCKLEPAKFRSHRIDQHHLAALLPTNHGFRRLFSTVKLRKYSSKPLTGFAWGWTDRVPSTSGSLPLLTNPLALQPSLPIQEKMPVALRRLTALMTPATSWSEPKIMQPVTVQIERIFPRKFHLQNRTSVFHVLVSCSHYRGKKIFIVWFYFIARIAGIAKIRFPERRGVRTFIEKVPMKRLASCRSRWFPRESRLYRQKSMRV